MLWNHTSIVFKPTSLQHLHFSFVRICLPIEGQRRDHLPHWSLWARRVTAGSPFLTQSPENRSSWLPSAQGEVTAGGTPCRGASKCLGRAQPAPAQPLRDWSALSCASVQGRGGWCPGHLWLSVRGRGGWRPGHLWLIFLTDQGHEVVVRIRRTWPRS